MRSVISITLSALVVLFSLTACASTDQPQLTAQERTELYRAAIEGARSSQENADRPIITAEDEGYETLLELLGLSQGDLSAFALSASMMNVQAYGVAAVYPAEGKDEAVRAGLQGFIDRQKQSFELYLADQYEIASNARLETLSDGTIVLVMCADQDTVFQSMRERIESGKL